MDSCVHIDIIKNLGDHSVPAEWAEYVKKNEQKDTAPGAPIAWESPSQPEEVQPGYGFVPDNESEETFYYHSDHLGSTSYITDDSARITQYTAYLPYGELLVDEHSSSEDMPYKFNGKELDEETGLYYYGARYMNPVASIWYGIDPHAEKYPNMGAYVYCWGNPINMIDPDGNDAIFICFPDYKANGIPFTGHAGVLLIDNKTGVTKYYEYGRYDTENKGWTRRIPIPDLKIDKNGKPTLESLNKVLKRISAKSGHHGDITGAYIISDKFEEMRAFAEQKIKENDDQNRKEYSIFSNNCANFAENVITQDKTVDKPTIYIYSPINVVDEYIEEGNAEVKYNSKTETTTIGKGDESDAKVKKE